MHIASPLADCVRARQTTYLEACNALDTAERCRMGDCKEEANPDSCLTFRHCFKDACIKVKNVLVTNELEKFKPEIQSFGRDIRTDS